MRNLSHVLIMLQCQFSPKFQQDISLACEVQLTSFEMHRKSQCDLFVDRKMLAIFEADENVSTVKILLDQYPILVDLFIISKYHDSGPYLIIWWTYSTLN